LKGFNKEVTEQEASEILEGCGIKSNRMIIIKNPSVIIACRNEEERVSMLKLIPKELILYDSITQGMDFFQTFEEMKSKDSSQVNSATEKKVDNIRQAMRLMNDQSKDLKEIQEQNAKIKKLIQNSESRIKLLVDNPLERHEQEIKLLMGEVAFLKNFTKKMEEPGKEQSPPRAMEQAKTPTKTSETDPIEIDAPQVPTNEMDVEVDSPSPPKNTKRKRSTNSGMNKKHKG